MSIKEMAQWTGGGLLILLTLIQIAPIKINPWTWLIRKFGDALSHNTIAKVDNLIRKVDLLEKDISQDRAQNARSRILRFGDELRLKQNHSKDMFDSTLIDIDIYEKYCLKHAEFANNVTLATIAIIKDTYQECLINNNFL